MAFAGFRFAESVMRAALGKKNEVTECTYVYLPGVAGGDAIKQITGQDFFSVPVELDANGAAKAIDVVSSADDKEKTLLKAAYTGLSGNISKGVEFVLSPPAR